MDSENILKACSRGDLQLLKAYINNFNREQIESIRDKNQASCLHYASRNGCLNVLDYLINEKNVCPILVSEVGATCLHDAAVKGQIKVIEWLLKNTSLSTSFEDSNGATIWHLSSKFDQINLINWLIDYESIEGAKATTFNGATCHHFAASSSAFKSLRQLLEIVPNYINSQMINGVTPTYFAIQENNIPIVKYLIKSGANINVRTENGMNSIHIACQNADIDMVRMLIDVYNVNINEKDYNGATPLHYACINGNPRTVAYLLSKKAEIIADKFGHTPLHDAAINAHIDCARLLMANNCDVSIRDSKGMSASEIAQANNFTLLADEIRKFELKKTIIQEIKAYNSKVDRSVQKPTNSILNEIQSQIFSDITVPSSTPSGDHEKLGEIIKNNSKTNTESHPFVQVMSKQSVYSSNNDLTQVSAIDELDKCIAEFEPDSSKNSNRIFINNSSLSDKTINNHNTLISPDQNKKNFNKISFEASNGPPPAPPLPVWSSNDANKKTQLEFLKTAVRTSKALNFIDELNNQFRKMKEFNSITPINLKFEQKLETIKKMTEYKVLRQTNEDFKVPEWKRQLIEKKKMRQELNEF